MTLTYLDLVHGQEIVLRREVVEHINAAAAWRHHVDASNTRSAGRSYRFHLQGCVGEGAVQQATGLQVAIPCLEGVDLDLDIPALRCEVKTGLPMEGRTKIRKDAVYVVVQPRGELERRLHLVLDEHAEPLPLDVELSVEVVAIAGGHEIYWRGESVPAEWEHRPGSRGKNYLIPAVHTNLSAALASVLAND